MADKKISALTVASTPLAGTEVVPLVQSGSTKKIAVSDLTAGRAVSATQYTSTIATGTPPLVVTSTTEVANLKAATATSADAVKSSATTGILQITGPAAASTRVMTVPDASFTVARTDAANSFTGNQGIGAAAAVSPIGANFVNLVLNSGVWGGTLSFPGNSGGFLGNRHSGNAGLGYYAVAGQGHTFYTDGASPTSIMELRSDRNAALIAGNLIIGTAGKGIDFSADGQAAGMTSELLDDYEEGTWTPGISGDGGSAGAAAFTSAGFYTKVGRLVTLHGYVAFTNLGSWTGRVAVTNTPYSANVNAAYGAAQVTKATIANALGVGSSTGAVSFTQVHFPWNSSVGGGGDHVRFTDLAADSFLAFTVTYITA